MLFTPLTWSADLVSCGAQELMCAAFLAQISVIALIGFGVANRILYKVRQTLCCRMHANTRMACTVLPYECTAAWCVRLA